MSGRAGRGVALALAVAVAWLPAAAQGVRATSLRGSRGAGVVNIPTADGGVARQFTAGLHVAGGSPVYSYLRYQLTDELELGGVVSPADQVGAPDTSRVGLLAHYRFLKEQGALPAMAVGIEGLSGYVVASHSLPGPRYLRAHLGGRVGERAGLFAGVSAVVNPVTVRRPGALATPVVTLGMDFDGATLNAGATLQWGPGVQVDVGVMDRGYLALATGINISAIF
ncbi:MAG: hypothetical protein IMX02_11835 [Limnochordaceae bacterium]|nr:hypothetical protein [Limnochordaceae bacterium]